jgi:hypothetical protein
MLSYRDVNDAMICDGWPARRLGVVMTKTDVYRGFTISWEEPPQTSAYWTADVASEEARLNALMRRHGAEVINGSTRDEMIANARKYIDALLG